MLPRMNTDETRIRKSALFSSVKIRVHLWLILVLS
jgi:hypothetical protein